MFEIYALVAVGVLAAVLVIRRFFSPSRRRALNPLQQTQSLPKSTTDHSPEQLAVLPERVLKSGDLNVQYQSDVHAKDLLLDAPEPTPGGSVRSSHLDSPSSSRSASVATAQTSHSGDSLVSSWSDRRLFRDFRGILNEGAETVPLPVSEDLPMREEDLIFGSLTPSIAQLLPETEARRELQQKSLLGAGYHSRAAWVNLSAIRFALSFLSLITVGVWLIMAPPAIETWLLGLLVIAPLLMWSMPPLIVAFKAAERKIDIERGLPDVLDMMNMGVSQGLTVPQSLRRIGREIAPVHPALAQELRIVDQQAQVGNLPHALRNFGQRIDSPEVNSFTSLLVQSETTGTSISKVLTEYSDSIRATLKERADSRANAASFQLLFPVALFLMPSVFLFLLGPAIVQLSDFVNNQAGTLQQGRQDAVRSLDQQPARNAPGPGALGASGNP